MVPPSSYKLNDLYQTAVSLLSDIIAIPSLSKEEGLVADTISKFLDQRSIHHSRIENNIIAWNNKFDKDKPTIFLNSHLDTVKPNPNYTLDPYHPVIKDEKLFGLGSNDAGGCLVSLLMTFLYLHEEDLSHNIVFIASAEEEISGRNGIELVFNNPNFLSHIGVKEDDFAIIGEPTLMQMAIAERGLMVIDAINHGISGHAAREEGESALYKAVDDIAKLKKHKFSKNSDLLGPVKISATVISTENRAHNVIPSTCEWVIDCRINEQYTFQEVLNELTALLDATLTPRSMRLKSTMISLDHRLILAGLSMEKTYYGSPTTSDKALIPVKALKMGPGDSARSHTADEFIYLSEIKKGIEDYINIIIKTI